MEILISSMLFFFKMLSYLTNKCNGFSGIDKLQCMMISKIMLSVYSSLETAFCLVLFFSVILFTTKHLVSTALATYLTKYPASTVFIGAYLDGATMPSTYC